VHHELDIRDWSAVTALMDELRPDAILPAAAQHSHLHVFGRSMPSM
jgi:dTDP-4-dehydrorhamnose reductase